MTAAVDTLLEVRDVAKAFRRPPTVAQRLTGRTPAVARVLDGVSVSVASNETLGVVGESGSGKSTLARCLVGLLEPDAGEIRFAGADVRAANQGELRRIRRDMQLVSQDPYGSLNPRLRVGPAISEPALVHGLVDRDGADELALRLLDRVGLPARAAGLRPKEFSGGQRQRIAIARALSVQPRLLIADEAVSALDVSVQAQILSLLERLAEELGLAMVFISHQLAVIARTADRVAVLYLGRVVETGPTAEVFARPAHPYTRALLSAHPSLGPRPQARLRISGEPPSPLAVPTGCRFHPRCPLAEERCRTVDPQAVEVSPRHHASCHLVTGPRSG